MFYFYNVNKIFDSFSGLQPCFIMLATITAIQAQYH